MSTCWKCGKQLAEGQVECEYGCDQPAAPAAAGEEALTAEMQRGAAAVAALLQHIENMGASGCKLPGHLNGVHYEITIRRL